MGVEPVLMAIVNVTPDSFSDGGRFLDPGAAIKAALQAIDEGARIVDIGGESTRPGALPVDAAEQVRRVVPVIRAVRAADHGVIISVDTTRAAVAEAALEAGADLVNDTSAGLDDPALLPLVAARGCGLVLMHRRLPPAQEAWSHELRSERASIMVRVQRELEARLRAALEAGVHADAIAVDPGLGFGKSVEENFELLARLGGLASLGCPVLVGASRKSFIGAATGVAEPAARISGSIAAALIAAKAGASVLRIHDVAPHREAMAVLRWTSRNDSGDARWLGTER